MLPDNNRYYVHADHHAVTDVDLRAGNNLEDVTRYLGPVPEYPARSNNKIETWVTNGNTSRTDLALVRIDVDHEQRLATPESSAVDLRTGLVDDEREFQDFGISLRILTRSTVLALDMEYRYWTFMEKHPAHESLPPGSRKEALEIVNWCYSSILLARQTPSTLPFTKHECQDLLGFFRMFPSTSISRLSSINELTSPGYRRRIRR